jgi:hypothetical protein
MKRIFGLNFAIFTVALLAACSGDKTGSPSSPTTGTVAAVTVASTATSASSFQMTATARMADGSTRDVTTASTWTTSNASLATISSAGLLTVVGAGEVNVSATYQNVAGTLKILVSGPPPVSRFSLSGIIREVAPVQRAVANARVEIVGGADAGAFVTSDAVGFFRFNTVSAGVVAVQATKDGYQAWRITNLSIDGDRSLDVAFFPTPPANASGATATARCNDGTWSWAPTRTDACTATGGVAYGVCPGPLCNGISPQ